MGEVHVGLSWPGAKHKRAKKKSSKAIVKLTGLRCPPKSSVLSSTVMPDSRTIGCYELRMYRNRVISALYFKLVLFVGRKLN